jgi:hypothetical protein
MRLAGPGLLAGRVAFLVILAATVRKTMAGDRPATAPKPAWNARPDVATVRKVHLRTVTRVKSATHPTSSGACSRLFLPNDRLDRWELLCCNGLLREQQTGALVKIAPARS